MSFLDSQEQKFAFRPLVHHSGTGHATALDEAAEATQAGAGWLGGHGVEVAIFSLGLIVFGVLAGRLYYLEYQRSGRWQAPK